MTLSSAPNDHIKAVHQDLDRLFAELGRRYFGDESPAIAQFLVEALVADYLKWRAKQERLSPTLLANGLLVLAYLAGLNVQAS